MDALCCVPNINIPATTEADLRHKHCFAAAISKRMHYIPATCNESILLLVCVFEFFLRVVRTVL